MQKRTRWLIPVIAGIMGISLFWLWPRGYCRSARSKYGLRLPRCPDGKPRQVLRIHGSELKRNGEGSVYVTASAVYTVSTADSWQTASIRDFEVALALVDTSGNETPIQPKDEWKRLGDQKWAQIILPEVRDGDYLLRARVRSKVGESSVDLPLALYAPARIHVLTDRPLYEPGNEVKFRALALRARDLTPIDLRPGTWIVRDPQGEVLLEEKAPAAEWGVVAGSFPLDAGAATGQWTVTWRSGNDEGQATFHVEPFTLPRFRVEATADQPFYQPGQRPTLSGSVVYSSGAPVAGAMVELQWSAQGAWPPPTSWMQGALPRQATTGANGRFVLELPEVPADLQGQVTLTAQLGAVDPAGDRVQGAASVLLSQDAIQVQAVSELGGGLVANANNRLYLRVTTADGRVLSGARLKVRRAWSGADPGIDVAADEDGVARIQIDPGPPVNVVIPPMPVRMQSRIPERLVSMTGATDLIAEDSPSLADQLELERWLAPLQACAKWVASEPQVAEVGLRVNRAGAIVATTAADSRLGGCVIATLRTRRLPAGNDRLYKLDVQFLPAPLPLLHAEVVAALDADEEMQELFHEAALDARDCLPGQEMLADMSELPWALEWRLRKGARNVQASWVSREAGMAMPQALAACVLGRAGRITLAEPATGDAMGVVRYTISYPYEPDDVPAPQPTIMKGYELLVDAESAGKSAGTTRLRMPPGEIPRLRVRADPVLVDPGDKVTLTLIRGPSYEGSLPRRISVHHLGQSQDIDVDEKTRTAMFAVPADGKGWYEVWAENERALVYVRSRDDLAVAISPERPHYAPGAMARLRILTRIGGQGAQAAVGLFGVDDSLGQLAALPGPDELGRIRPEIPMTERAFAALDAQALSLGRIRGHNAAEATILRVARIPDPAELDVVVNSSAEATFDPVAELTDRFYIALAELHAQVRAWEASAPPDEKMTPATMARLWQKALDACAGRGERVDDAFGRRMRLHYLPQDLLALTDPRHVVVVGTRLPEDVENWTEWVARRRP